jgi:protease-4
MKGFFKYFLASFLAVCVALLVLTLIGLGSLSAIMSTGPDEVKIKPGTVLVLNLDRRITERTIDNPLESFDMRTMETQTSLGLTDIILNLEKAEKDPNICGLLIKTGQMGQGVSTSDEIREAIIRFKKSGKFAVAYGDLFTQGNYFIASAADDVYMNPSGVLEFRGLRSETIFFRKALEKIGVEVQVIREGKYKSAVEPFLMESMSPASKEQVTAYVSAVWDHMLAGIADSRGKNVIELNLLADNWISRTPQGVLASGLVDSLLYEDQVLDLLKKQSKIGASEKLRTISVDQYKLVADPNRKEYTPDRIAIIYGTGSIAMEASGSQSIGKDLAQTFAKARKDSKIKAIVFRINSGGGDALASDIIRREVELTAAVKPVIVSMGDVAGSGGYWIAAPGTKILSGPTSLTGSIGVFGLIPNLENLLTDKIGISFDGIQTNKLAGTGSIYRPLLPEEQAVFEDQMNEIYDRFLELVSRTRNLSKAAVDSVGQGRIWAGLAAREAGLIDEIGGIHDAIRLAAAEAKIENWRLRELPVLKNPVNELINELTGKKSPAESILARQVPVLRDLQDILTGGKIQARLPYRIDIY